MSRRYLHLIDRSRQFRSDYSRQATLERESDHRVAGAIDQDESIARPCCAAVHLISAKPRGGSVDNREEVKWIPRHGLISTPGRWRCCSMFWNIQRGRRPGG